MLHKSHFACATTLAIQIKSHFYCISFIREQIRSGEYEGLEEKLKDSKWAPDFGQAAFVPSWGGTVTGVRKFLIA